MRPAAVFLSLFVLASAASAAWFEISPPAPTSDTPIAVTFTTESLADCGPTQGDVTINGTSIQVRLFRRDASPSCPPDIRPRIVRVDLGALPLGEYSLVAEYKTIEWRGKFVVRNPAVRLAVTSRSGGLPVAISIDNARSVKFGGVAASLFRQSGRIVAIAPPHDPGLYDIEIADANGQQLTFSAAIYYFDPNAPPDATIFEKVLFPILDRVLGAAGAQWSTVATIENQSADAIETFAQLNIVPKLRPSFSFFEFAGHGYPHGALLHIPRQSSQGLAFSLRISETSGVLAPGVDLLPVRESQFFRSVLTLANVPVSSEYRTRVRIYGLDPLPETYVSISALLSGDPLRAWGEILPLHRSTSVDEPAYGELDLNSVPELRGRDRVTVLISAPWGAPVWAFASAVHGVSQRTLIIRPQ